MTKISSHLYDKLPNVYRTQDEEVKGQYPLPLKRFLQILGVGFDFMEEKVNGLSNMYNVDACPPEFLPLLAETLGFKFPYALSEREQRRFVKMLPHLYKLKGTPQSFEYLAREIYGVSCRVRAYKETYKEGMTPKEWRRIYVDIMADAEQFNLARREAYFRNYAEVVRPVNTILTMLLSLFYEEVYSRERAQELEGEEKLIIADVPLVEKYRYRTYVDGKPLYDVLINDDITRAFILNSSKLYNGQKVTTKDVISETFLPDIFTFTHAEEELYRIARHADSYIPFALNSSLLNNLNYGLGFIGISDIIEESHQDTFHSVIRDAYLKESIDFSSISEESYRYRIFVDGIDVCEKNNNILIASSINSFILNKGKIYGGQEVKAVSPLNDLFYLDTPYDISEDKYTRKIEDSKIPFELNYSRLNKSHSLTQFSGEDSLGDKFEDKVSLNILEHELNTDIRNIDEEKYTIEKEDSSSASIVEMRPSSFLNSTIKLNTSFHTTNYNTNRILSF